MNTLIVDKPQAHISYKAAKLYTAQQTIPVKLIDLLVITESVTIDTKSIINIANANVPILYLSNDNKHFALTLPAIAKNGDLKALQYSNLSQNLTIAKKLLFEKFVSHKASLEHFELTINIEDELTHLALAKTIDELMGVEGAFAKRYFGYYFSLFEKRLTKGFRSKNPPLDPINAMLSYVYTLSYYTITAKLYMRGFDPSLSYLHTPFRNHFALSSDLLEPLRANINRFVAELFLKHILRAEDFTCKNGVYLKNETRRQLWSHLKPFMQIINTHINAQIITLKRQLEKNDL